MAATVVVWVAATSLDLGTKAAVWVAMTNLDLGTKTVVVWPHH
jgi:hypothetical protein